LDFFSLSQGDVAVQLKASRSPSLTPLKTAIDRLVTRGTTQGATVFNLDLRKPFGLDTTALEDSLRQYIRDTYPDKDVSLIVNEYEFVPN
jgi:hypothetical protein